MERRQDMLIAIDIGNTQTVIGLYEASSLLRMTECILVAGTSSVRLERARIAAGVEASR